MLSGNPLAAHCTSLLRFPPNKAVLRTGGRRLLDAPVPSARPRLWWGGAVPFDAIYPLHIWLWEAAPSQPPQTNPSSRSPNRGQGISCSAHSSHSNLAAEVQCLFLSRVMSRASGIAAGLCEQEVIKSAYPPGGRLINSTFSPRCGADTHTRAVSIHRLPHSSPLGRLVSPSCFAFFPFFQREDEDDIGQTGI